MEIALKYKEKKAKVFFVFFVLFLLNINKKMITIFITFNYHKMVKKLTFKSPIATNLSSASSPYSQIQIDYIDFDPEVGDIITLFSNKFNIPKST